LVFRAAPGFAVIQRVLLLLFATPGAGGVWPWPFSAGGEIQGSAGPSTALEVRLQWEVETVKAVAASALDRFRPHRCLDRMAIASFSQSGRMRARRRAPSLSPDAQASADGKPVILRLYPIRRNFSVADAALSSPPARWTPGRGVRQPGMHVLFQY